MKVFLAGIESFTEQERNFVQGNGVNGLASFFNMNTKTAEILPYLDNFLLDSGAYTLFASGRHVDWIDYIKKYSEFITAYNIRHFFELDVDSLIGYDKVVVLRKKSETGYFFRRLRALRSPKDTRSSIMGFIKMMPQGTLIPIAARISTKLLALQSSTGAGTRCRLMRLSLIKTKQRLSIPA